MRKSAGTNPSRYRSAAYAHAGIAK